MQYTCGLPGLDLTAHDCESDKVRQALRLGLLIAWAMGLVAPAGAQAAAILSSGPGSVTVDAARLNAVTVLDVKWRFSPDDDPRFSQAQLDDSKWPLISPGSGTLADEHAPNAPDGRDWVRLHLRVLNPGPALAITVMAGDMTYAMFANGKVIGATRSFGRMSYLGHSQVIALPQASEIALSIHMVDPKRQLLHGVPIGRITIGPRQAMEDSNELAYYRVLATFQASELVLSGVLLAFVLFALVLSFAQRNHPEYLWVAIFCLLLGAHTVTVLAISDGALPAAHWAQDVPEFMFAGMVIASLEFIAAIAGKRGGWMLRFVEAASLVWPLLFALRIYGPQDVAIPSSSALWLLEMSYLLVSAYRRGNTECGFLLPMIFHPCSVLLLQIAVVLPPAIGMPLLMSLYVNWTVGGVGFNLYDVGTAFVIAGLLAVVLYRFIRVSKDEEVAAAELEAARAVQKLLIPTTQASTPGFVTESVYLPSRQVGGDFFLVLNAPSASGDEGLLAIMGDVSGKGLQAAMVVSTIIGGLRMKPSRNPAELLANVNRMLFGHVAGFATCCAALIEQDGRIRIANAGNPAPYCNGEEIPTLPGLPLGLVADVLYEETEYVLPLGMQLTFVSDGIVEATCATDGELFGFERTKAMSRQPASTIAEAACLFGKGKPQADDITVFTVVRL